MNRVIGWSALLICAIAWLALFVASGFSVLALDLGLIGALGVTGATQAHAYDDHHHSGR
jgi:hypothetical protein